MKKHLYVTYWSPNGCNDLLVVNDNYEIVACIQDATFGINVAVKGSRATVADMCGIIGVPTSKINYEFQTPVKKIDKATLLRKLAVNPIDPKGERVVRELKKAGVL